MKHIIKAILIGIMLLILFSFKASAQKKEKKDYSNIWMVVGVKKDIVKLKKKVALQPTYYKIRVECVDSFYLGREIYFKP